MSWPQVFQLGNANAPSTIADRSRTAISSDAVIQISLGVIAYSLLTFDLGSWRLFNQHEMLAVRPAQEMAISGDYIVPTYAGLPRLEKPPGFYWVLTAILSVTGELTTFTARLPSAIAAIFLAWLVGRWSRLRYGPVAGYGAFIAQSTSLYVLTYGRTAEADMLLCALMTSAMLVAAPANNSGQTFWEKQARWSAVGVLAAATYLLKFHFGPILIYTPLVVWLVCVRRWKELAHAVINPVALVCLCAAIFVWPLLVLSRIPEAAEVWNSETWGRFQGDITTQPFWYYLPILLWITMPWTPLALPGALLSWKRTGWWQTRFDSRESFLWVWLVVQLLLLSVSANKHKHYLLPLLPVFAIWTGLRIDQLTCIVRNGGRILPPWGAVLASVALFAGMVYAIARLGHLSEITAPIPVEVMFVTVAVGGSLVFLLMAYRNPGTAAVLAAFLFLCGYTVSNRVVLPNCDRRIAVRDFSQSVTESIPAGESILAIGMRRDVLLGYLPQARAVELEDAKSFRTSTSGSRYWLMPRYLEKGFTEQIGGEWEEVLSSTKVAPVGLRSSFIEGGLVLLINTNTHE
ncbi:ArnT family glycosyltransferase [Calycomorphotria hydatis]|uniref:Undecaprenyl phosphate-alpha-4-amino-4-deoxy-L-arabinose arabinosyl transferase n=1 Tax=Calycomorphotria hydatis TaxID=2528027 RepID=A0A517TCA3_9PLAN|nr:glycosyltransferase family 39 protein [Calycomorphotria hydatis]QDT66015.1 Undecaprenyl phosphate-alpha-4-amino-4-deoxy-L-arabinose arabinosyl transferase [Calycomorphotria hydatis]